MDNVLELLVKLKDQTQAGLGTIKTGLNNLETAADEVSGAVSNFKRTLADVKAATLGKVQTGLDNLKGKADEVSGAVFNLRNGLIALGAAAAVKKIVDTSSAFENYGVALETVTGSAENAKKAMDWIEVFTAKTPYELDQVAKGFSSLSAYGLDATKHMQVLGDTASAMNKPLMGAVEMMADAVTGEFERLKEFGIRSKTVGDEVTFSWLQNGKQMEKTVNKTGKAIEDGLLQILEGRFKGSMERFSSTWTGMFSNLQDSWTLFKKSIGDAGAFDYLKGLLGQLIAKINELKENGKLDEWAKRFSDVIIQVADIVKGYIGTGAELISHFDGLIAKAVELIPFVVDIGIKVGLAASAFSAMLPIVVAIAGAFATFVISQLMVDFTGLVIASGLLGTKLTSLLTIFRTISAGAVMLKGAFVALAAGWAVGSWLNTFPEVQKAAQIMFGAMDMMISETKLEFLELRKAWNVFTGDMEEAEYIDRLIEGEKLHQKEIKLTIKGIQEEYSEKKKGAETAVKVEQEKAAAVQSRADIEKQVSDLAKKDLKERIEGFKDETSSRKAEIEKQLTAISEAEAEGIISHEEAVEKKLELEKKFATERLKDAKEAVAEAKKLFGAESEEYKKAVENMKAAEDGHTKFREKAAQARIKARDAELKKQEESYKKEQALADSALSQKEAQIKKEMALVDENAAKGVISEQDAVNQKIELERQLYEFKVTAAQQAIDAVIAQYGRDSEEYQKAVSAKMNAEANLQEFKAQAAASIAESQTKATEATKETTEATEEASGELQGYSETIVQCAKATDDAKEKNKEYADGLRDISGNLSGLSADIKTALIDSTASAADAMNGLNETSTTALSGMQEAFDGLGRTITETEFSAFQADAETAMAALEKSIQGLIEKKEELRDKINETNEEIADIEQTTADLIRESQRSLYTEEDQLLDKRAEAQESYQEAVRLASEGEYEAAKELFLKSRDLASDLLQEVKDFSDEIRGIEKTTAEMIRDIQRDLMSEQEAWQSDRMEAERLYQEATAAWNAGNAEQAKAMFTESQKLAKSLARTVKDENGNVIKSYEETSSIAIDLVNKTGEGALGSMKQFANETTAAAEKSNNEMMGLMKSAGDEAAGAMTKHRQNLENEETAITAAILKSQEQIDELVKHLDEFASKLAEPYELGLDTEEAESALDKLMNKYSNYLEHMKSKQVELQAQMRTQADGFNRYNMEIYRGQQEEIRKTEQMIEQLQYSAKQDQQMNFDFTGTGSTKKPISEKVAEIMGRFGDFSGFVSSIKPAINLDMTAVTSGIAKAQEAVSGMAGSLANLDIDGTVSKIANLDFDNLGDKLKDLDLSGAGSGASSGGKKVELTIKSEETGKTATVETSDVDYGTFMDILAGAKLRAI